MQPFSGFNATVLWLCCLEMDYDSEGEREKKRREHRMDKFSVPSNDFRKLIQKLDDDPNDRRRADPGLDSVARPTALHLYCKDFRNVHP
jgi:hypothetical protein